MFIAASKCVNKDNKTNKFNIFLNTENPIRLKLSFARRLSLLGASDSIKAISQRWFEKYNNDGEIKKI